MCCSDVLCMETDPKYISSLAFRGSRDPGLRAFGQNPREAALEFTLI